ncbi:hypothetical protein D9758_006826 [Tetrapyrgos nigripes]|uniref:Flavin reductase like domain-containing protein n=1 Tax=Tetrapyrgos nigripes TaxID=182062 RepID=A0A8H5FTP5_9AGAR|nr:hypothetical protein D9758_006826 [Tetrapyrgos nigripes]
MAAPSRTQTIVRANTMYHTMLGRIRSLRVAKPGFRENESPYVRTRAQLLALEIVLSSGIGSRHDGGTLSNLICANITGQALCTEKGFLPCPRNRDPYFVLSPSCAFSGQTNKIPSIDLLNLASSNEGGNCDIRSKDFKLCFLGCTDIRDLVKTVNNLPKDYRGKCTILINNSSPIHINQVLVVLYILLCSNGASLEECAELATHLMYSAFLTRPGAAYLQKAIDKIYETEGDISFRASFPTRGSGNIHTLQTLMGVKQPLEMFQTSFSFVKGLKRMRNFLSIPEVMDQHDHLFSKLIPTHRAAFKRFHETGVLAPFSLSTDHFTHPNRLLFSPNGEWLQPDYFNPFRGWDVAASQATGTLKRGVDSGDIFGCLFFHVKAQFREFARRFQYLSIDIYITQFNPKILSSGLLAGVLPAFPSDGCFDRIHVGDLIDSVGIQDCLADWTPLLNSSNEHAALLMHSKIWCATRPDALALSNPIVAKGVLIEKCNQNPDLVRRAKFQKMCSQGLRSPTLLKILESLDVFADHSLWFHEYLRDEEAESTAASLGLQLRERNQIHPKRFGVPLDAPWDQLPDLGRSEFYYTSLSGVDFRTRFIEFGLSGHVTAMWTLGRRLLSRAANDERVQAQFRSLLRECAQPVTVLTSFLPSSTHYHGATLSSFTSIAMDPFPLVAFSLRIPSRMAASLAKVHSNNQNGIDPDVGSHMVVNILSAAQANTAVIFSRPDLHPDPFSEVKYSLNSEGIPILDGSLGAISCKLVAPPIPLHDLDVLKGAFGNSDTKAQVANPAASLQGGAVSELFLARVTNVEKLAIEEVEDGHSETIPLLYRRRGYTGCGPTISTIQKPRS